MTRLLNHRQEAFCRHFCATGNAAAAARKAGYSVNSARQTGHELLEKPWIIERAQAIRDGWRQTAQAEAAVLLARLEQAWDAAVAANDGRGSPGHMLQVIRLQAEITGMIAKGAGNRADLWALPGEAAETEGGTADAETPMQAALRHGRYRAERALALRRTLARRADGLRHRDREAVRDLRGQLALVGEIEARRELGRSIRSIRSIRAVRGAGDAAGGPGGSLTFPDILAVPAVTTADDALIDAASAGYAAHRLDGQEGPAAARPGDGSGVHPGNS